MSESGKLPPNGSHPDEKSDEFSQLNAELEQLDNALSKLEDNSNAFNANAMSLLLEIKQLREESQLEQATPAKDTDMYRHKSSPEYVDFVRDLNRHMNEVLDSSDKQFLIHSLKQYFTYKDVEKFALSLESCLNTPRKRDLLLKIRIIIAKQDLIKFDTLAPYNQKRSRDSKLSGRGHHSYPKRTRRNRAATTSVDPPKDRGSVQYDSSRKVRVVRIPGSEEELGFNIRGGKDFGVGIYVSAIEKRMLADKCGLKPGDQILEVNGIDFTNIPHSTAVKVLKSRGNLNLMVQRVGLIPRDRSGETHFIWIDPQSGKPIKGSTSVEPAEDNAYEQKSDLQLMTRTDERKVVLNVAEDGNIGLSIRGGREYGLGIYLSIVDENSSAQDAGLRVGDQIMRVNNISFHNISHERAVQVLKSYTHLMLTIRNVGRIPHTFKPAKPSYDSSTFPKSRSKKQRPPLNNLQQRNTVDGLNLIFKSRDDSEKEHDKTVSVQEEDRSNWETKRKTATHVEPPAVSRVKRTQESTTGGTPPSPMFTRFVGGITTLSTQGLSQSREMLLDRTRKAAGEYILSDVKAAIKKYDENKELEPFARFFRDMDVFPDKKLVIQDARCVLEPRHVELFDRIVAYRPEGTVLKPNKRASLTGPHSGGGFVKPAPRERPPHVHKLHPSLLRVFENENIAEMLDPASYPFQRVAVEDRIRTRDSFLAMQELNAERGEELQLGGVKKVLVEIFKNSPILGLSISGGSDTPNPEVIIEEVKPRGAAYSDGFLKPGFEIVSVNSTPLTGHSHREVVDIISRAFADSKDTIDMVVIPN
ncbi:Whirlin-like [Oopsacas minuta]|uniref:Whirlin-like n=1 Tax=Oopsacas minuta TaxID=111878 RepID=A0AAV7KJ55_9METZ|nr:Whirlin-like [Oopsacas minuta]